MIDDGNDNNEGLANDDYLIEDTEFFNLDVDFDSDDILHVIPQFDNVELIRDLENEDSFEILSRWFASLNATYVDAITSLDGSVESFLIHAESLICRFLLSDLYRLEFLTVPQTLRLVYYLSNFLDTLLKCNSVFKIVFIESYLSYLQNLSPLAVFARQVFLALCKVKYAEHNDILIFSSIMDFATNHDAQLTSFVLIDDLYEFTESMGDKIHDLHTYSLSLLAASAMMNVYFALMGGMEEKGRRFFCFAFYTTVIVNPIKKTIESIELKAERDYKAYYDNLLDRCTACDFFEKFKLTLQKANLNIDVSIIGIREFIYIWACLEYKSRYNLETEVTDFMALSLLICSNVMRNLSLEDRCFADSFKDWSKEELFESYTKNYIEVLNDILYHIISKNEIFDYFLINCRNNSVAKDIADLYDHRLLKLIVLIFDGKIESLPAIYGLSQKNIETINFLFREFITDSSSFEIPYSPNPKEISYTPPEPKHILPFSNKLFDELCSPETKNYIISTEKPGNVYYDFKAFNRVHNWNDDYYFELAKHAINVRHIEVRNLFLAQQRLSDDPRKRKKQIQKIFQKGAYTVHRFAVSLTDEYVLKNALQVLREGTHVWSIKAPPDTKSIKHKGLKNDQSKAKPEKVLAIIEENLKKAQKKKELLDNTKLPSVLSNIDGILKKTTLKTFYTATIEFTCGPVQSIGLLSKFPSMKFELESSKRAAIVRLLSVLYKAITQIFNCVETDLDDLNNLYIFIFYLCNTFFVTFFESLEIADIQAIQKLLIAMGFTNCARKIFEKWYKKSLKALSNETSNNEIKSKSNSSKNKKKDTKAEKKKESKSKKDVTNSTTEIDSKVLKNLKSALVDPKNVTKVSRAISSDLESEVQLDFMGHLMERSLKSSSDPRVPFNPDAWQKRLLNIIDQQKNALVCAPTASGKTFLCFYVMEKVLTYDDTSIVVYVCPSKALCHQVEHDIRSRFRSKEYPNYCKSILSHNFLSELFEPKAINAQVITTLPSIFEMMLMSPEYFHWISRIKYVILDEIHTIGENSEMGCKLETILELITCPFLALSATISFPESFRSWLEKTLSPTSNCKSVEFIRFDERYADFDHYIYMPEEKEFTLRPFNSYTCITYRQIYSENITEYFYAASKETVQAYFILRRFLMRRCLNNIQDLSKQCKLEIDYFCDELLPKFYFSGTDFIKKKQYRYYLISVLNSYMSLVRFGAINENLYNQLQSVFSKTHKLQSSYIWDTKVTNEDKLDTFISELEQEENYKFEFEYNTHNKAYSIVKQFYGFCCDLREKHLTPALLFNLDNHEVRNLGLSLINYLVQKQYEYYYSTPERAAQTKAKNKERQDKYKMELKLLEEMKKLQSLSKEQKEEQGLSNNINMPDPIPPTDVADDFTYEFNFSNQRVWGTQFDEVTRIITSLRGGNVFRKTIQEGLKRGIGIHYNGMPRKIRVAVEMLFRLGYLTIILSTKTLSVGINVPCRSTVFLGTHMELTPLMFRQTAGRAGRRGFDVSGSIIFWSVPFFKIQRLLCSSLPIITNEISVSPTLALKTYSYLHNLPAYTSMDVYRECEENFKRVYKTTLYSLTTDILHNDDRLRDNINQSSITALRYSVELIAQHSLIDSNAKCCGLYGIPIFSETHSSYSMVYVAMIMSNIIYNRINNVNREEPYSLPFHKLILEKALSVKSLSDTWREQEVLNIICTIFQLTPLCHNLRLRMKYLPGFDPFLKTFPSEIYMFLKTWDSRVLSIAIEYFKATTITLGYHNDTKLPYSNSDFSYKTSLDKSCILSQYLSRNKVNAYVRSPYAAICGKEDHDILFKEELLISTKNEIPINPLSLPQYTSRWFKDSDGSIRPYSSKFFLEFFETLNLPKAAINCGILSSLAFNHVAELYDLVYYTKIYLEKIVPKSDVFFTTMKSVDELWQFALRHVAA